MLGEYYNTPDFVGTVKLTRVKRAVGWKYAEKMKNAYYVLVRKPDSKRSLGTPSYTRMNKLNVKIHFRGRYWGSGNELVSAAAG